MPAWANSNRQAHSLYPELAAETGIFGFTAFMGIIFLMLYRLVDVGRLWSTSQLAHLATAFILSVLGYLSTAIFLHFSYQRYFWLFLSASRCLYPDS